MKTNYLKSPFGLAIGIMLLFCVMTTMANQPQNKFIAQSFAAPSILTGQNVYQRGEVVRISGSGFKAFEQVELFFKQYDSLLQQDNLINRWVVYANGKGNISTEINVDSFYTAQSLYTVTAYGSKTKFSAETTFQTDSAILAAAADLDQCANGPFSAPVTCTGSAWVNGNVNEQKGHYVEGDSIAYRMKLTGLTPGSTGNTLTIEWDTTKQGKHAIDYLTTFDRTQVNADPCSGVTGCNLAGPFDTEPIPEDPMVTGAGVTQIPGVFTLFNGDITGVSAYTTTGTFAGDSSTRITITFTATTSNPVLAWGGHISTRQDWGPNSSATSIPGSPYHTRLIELNGSGGQQDRALAAAAVILQSQIIIIKQADVESLVSFGFDFTTPGGMVTSFTLVDDGVNTGEGFNQRTFSGLTTFGQYEVFESNTGGVYNLTGISCMESGAVGTNTPTVIGPADVQARTAPINLDEGETVTCTFTNSIVTAARASVQGRIADDYGNPVARTRVSILNTVSGEASTVYTNSFGRYQFNELPIGDFYVVMVENRKYSFSPSSFNFVLNEDINDLNFSAALR